MRVGLVGYNCATGLGELNRQLSLYGSISAWLVKKHPKKRFNPKAAVPLYLENQVEQFVRTVDIVVFCERPFFPNLIPLCKKYNKRIVCIPMQEWMPQNLSDWPSQVDLFICPTVHCYEQFYLDLPCALFPWPVDLGIAEYRQRTKCKEFLFINGNGGWKGRKGIDTILEVLHKWPTLPIVAYSQVNISPRIKRTPEVRTQKDLYKRGDIFIAPHSVDGIGLEINEAMACGIPVVTTNGMPWNERPAIARIDSTVSTRVVNRSVDWYTPSAASLLSICRKLVETDIAKESKEARQWAEDNSWNATSIARFKELVEG